MVYSPINVKLVQNSFTSGALLVSLDPSANSPIVCQKYDIRVVANNFSVIGMDAIATKTVINDFTITSTPLSFAIPINPAVMSDGTKYKVTIRLYSSSSTTYTPPTDNLFYYDTAVYTIAPSVAGVAGGVSVSSNPTGADSSFDITNVVIYRGSTRVLETESFFSDVGVSKLFMSCTTLDVSNNKITTGTEYSLASTPFVTSNLSSTSYNFKITSEMNQRVTDAAYELWGYLSLSSQFTFGINIVANDATIGYVINNPVISVKLGDVIGIVSDYPIEITIDSWAYYKNNYMFDSLTLEIYDASTNTLLKQTDPSKYTKNLNNFEKDSNNAVTNVVKFSKNDLVNETNEVPLMNGVTYKFKTILNFTTQSLYKPTVVRSATKEGQFTDGILPIVSGNAKNSWELNTDKSAGLVVEFQKTDQFYGLSDNRPYNLEGNTKVKAEYSTFDVSGNQGAWSDWSVLSGGSISQPALPSGINYNLSSANLDGVYDVPVYNTVEKRGNVQPPVYIYATIPDQAKYSAVQIRLSLITTNATFSTKTSTDYNVPRVTGTTYSNNQVVDNTVTFRYHPKPVAHDFANDKPICTSAGAAISFDVPLTVYPFFKAVVTTSDGVFIGSVADITNPNAYDANNALLWNQSVARIGQGLSYTPADASFTLKVKYVSSENSAISVEQSMQVQRHGFPSSSFSITSCRWNKSNQEIDYALAISATSTSADRIDGWNMYTSATDASGNLLKDASGNLLRDASGNLVRDASGNVYTLQQYNKMISGGLTQNVTLANVNYPDYKNIAVTFVATRSLYLNPANFDKQVETIGAGLGDTKQTLVTKLPAVLPRINSADIKLEDMVYNVITGGAQYAKLTAKVPSNASGLQITDKSTTSPDGVVDNALVRTIALTNSAVERKYEISAKYYSVDTPTVQYVYSLPVIVTFKTSISNRLAPVIENKSYNISNTNFTVGYTSANAGSWLNSNTALVSNVYVRKTGSIGDGTLVGDNDGSVVISGFNGDNVSMYVQDAFTTTYTVDNSSQPSVVQTVKSDSSVAFDLAANPQIDESSIVVDGTNKRITVDVKNMGTPYLNNAMLVVSQDSTINEGDSGYYGVAYFDDQSVTGLQSVQTNKITISGVNAQALQTLSVSTSETGMSKVTKLTFSSINLANTNPVNVSLFIGNKTEGSDSCAVAKDVIYPHATPVLSGSVAYAAGYTATATYTFNTNVSAIKVMKSDGTTIFASQAVSSGTATIVIPYTDADISGAKSFYVVALGNSFAPESMASASQLLATPKPPGVVQTDTNIALKMLNKIEGLGPLNVAVDANDNIWATDVSNHCIKQFTSSGTYVKQFGSFGTGNGQFKGPSGIAIDGSGNLYITDINNHRIQKFTSAGVYLSQFGSNGTGNGQFVVPNSIAIDTFGNLIIIDYNRIQKFTSAGVYLSNIGSYGSNDGQYSNPVGVTVDNAGNIVIADNANHRIQKFTSDGVYLSKFGSTGTGNGQFNYPKGVAVDPVGNIIVSDTDNSRLQIFTSSGTYVRTFGSFGAGDGQFSYPRGIAITKAGTILVADKENYRIQIIGS